METQAQGEQVTGRRRPLKVGAVLSGPPSVCPHATSFALIKWALKAKQVPGSLAQPAWPPGPRPRPTSDKHQPPHGGHRLRGGAAPASELLAGDAPSFFFVLLEPGSSQTPPSRGESGADLAQELGGKPSRPGSQHFLLPKHQASPSSSKNLQREGPHSHRHPIKSQKLADVCTAMLRAACYGPISQMEKRPCLSWGTAQGHHPFRLQAVLQHILKRKKVTVYGKWKARVTSRRKKESEPGLLPRASPTDDTASPRGPGSGVAGFIKLPLKWWRCPRPHPHGDSESLMQGSHCYSDN
uniref:uncharacterized protein LOC120890961 n=1 Tax=Ictidomys tridecemlineatus TaxID=43179 RepID=UPI001A9D74D4|nr:uncharacterized protein LOC120890961 [Ictidomys tridecemlineatus]